MGLDEGVSKILGEAGFHLSRQGAISLVSGVPVLIRLGAEKSLFVLGLSNADGSLVIESLKISGLSIEDKKVNVASDHVSVPLGGRILRKSAGEDARKLLTFLERMLPGIVDRASASCSYCESNEASVAVIHDGKPRAACRKCLEYPDVANLVERGISFEEYRTGLARFSKNQRIQFAVIPFLFLPMLISLKVLSRYPEWNVLDRGKFSWFVLIAHVLATCVLIVVFKIIPRVDEIFSTGSMPGFEKWAKWFFAILIPMMTVDPLAYWGPVFLNSHLDRTMGTYYICEVVPRIGYPGNDLRCDGIADTVRVPHGKVYSEAIDMRHPGTRVRILVKDGWLKARWVAHVKKVL